MYVYITYYMYTRIHTQGYEYKYIFIMYIRIYINMYMYI